MVWQDRDKGESGVQFPYRYRVMLVDDEEEVREGVREKVEWNRCGFELVAEASNGQEAWETAKTVAPDVVITDIRMPFMSGLELCHNLRTMFPDICLVILTGYDDFDYAKRAIQENVTEYILKPVNFGEFTALMGRIREKLDQHLAKQYDLKRLREQYEMSLPAMREQLLARLLDSSVQEEWAREKAREMRLSIAGEKWTIALIRYNGGEVASRERELLPHMVRQRAEKELPRYCPVICFLYQDYVAVLATIERQQDMLQLINGMRQICLSAQRFLQLELAVGIGSTCTALSQLRRSAMEARNALDYQTMVGEEAVSQPSARIVCADAATDLVMYAMEGKALLTCCAQETGSLPELTTLFMKKIHLLSSWIFYAQFTRNEAKLACFLYSNTQDRQEVRYTQEQIGSVTGMSRVSVSNCLRDLQQRDFVRVAYKRIRVLDRAGLRALFGEQDFY